MKSPIAKFFTDAEMDALRAAVGAEPGDLVCMVADERALANEVLGVLRLTLADELGIERHGFDDAVGRRLPDVQVRRGRGALGGEPPPVHAARSSSTRTSSSPTRAPC